MGRTRIIDKEEGLGEVEGLPGPGCLAEYERTLCRGIFQANRNKIAWSVDMRCKETIKPRTSRLQAGSTNQSKYIPARGGSTPATWQT